MSEFGWQVFLPCEIELKRFLQCGHRRINAWG